ncbi:MAG: hypothetical protein LW636_06825 [Planctomycetaceae bacterium]|nr:hypothetical protein [Planctomycetaceae bacterium]
MPARDTTARPFQRTRFACVVVSACLAMQGCPPRVEGERAAADPSAQAIETERESAVAAFVELIALHNANAAALAEFESQGVVELRRPDGEGGQRFDQCDLDVSIAPAGRGSVRLKKASETLAWIGSDGSSAWAFLMQEKPPRAVVFEGLRDASFARPEGASGSDVWPLLSPESLRILLGIAEVPPAYRLLRLPGADVLKPIETRYELEWEVVPSLRAAMRFGADRRPSEVLLRGADGVLVARSELSEPVRARAENLAQGAWPTVARKIGIVAPRLDGRADIFLGEPTAMIRRAKPHFFDFEELQRRIRPEQVEFISRPKPPETNPDGAKPRVESP